MGVTNENTVKFTCDCGCGSTIKFVLEDVQSGKVTPSDEYFSMIIIQRNFVEPKAQEAADDGKYILFTKECLNNWKHKYKASRSPRQIAEDESKEVK